MVRFGARYFNASERAVVPPAAVLPTHRSGRCRIIGASRRPGHPNRPLKARTPARPDGAILKPPAPAAGGFFLRAALVRTSTAAGWGGAETRRAEGAWRFYLA